ncbi:MAG: 5-oxoprolinase subunit PxpB [Bacteroidota bacterium]
MRIIPYGEKAILLEFEQQISSTINQEVQQWEQVINHAQLPYLSYTIPAYASLVLVFDRPVKQMLNLIKQINTLKINRKDQATEKKQRNLRIPVCYESPFALDQQYLMDTFQKTWEAIVSTHQSKTYYVYMLGFSPGFAFMGKIPTSLETKRKATPRLKVPAGSVGIAGQQTGIYPDEIPGGWQILGRTPIPIFAPLKEEPFLFQAGDQVQFMAIDQTQFKHIQVEVQAEIFNWKQLYV